MTYTHLSEAEQAVKRATMTIAHACRVLEISRNTLLKWHKSGQIKLIELGPEQHKIRRVPVAEVERLKVAC